MERDKEITNVKLTDGSLIFNGDNLEVLSTLETNSIDSIVTDPPYGLKLLGNKWDYDIPSSGTWKEFLRVLKPGGHLLSFSSPRTYHRMATAIEESGFEIKDQLMWIYGQGFPKSTNMVKQIKGWDGWGTNLKPAHEPIVMARKHLDGTYKENVLKWGTGLLNIDLSRIKTGVQPTPAHRTKNTNQGDVFNFRENNYKPNKLGRFPSNVIISEVAGEEIETMKMGGSKFFYCPKINTKDKGIGNTHPTVKPTVLMQYLVRLVTPQWGKVLDGYFGSGSTGKACIREGFEFIGIELETDYYNMAVNRCKQELLLTPKKFKPAA